MREDYVTKEAIECWQLCEEVIKMAGLEYDLFDYRSTKEMFNVVKHATNSYFGTDYTTDDLRMAYSMIDEDLSEEDIIEISSIENKSNKNHDIYKNYDIDDLCKFKVDWNMNIA